MFEHKGYKYSSYVTNLNCDAEKVVEFYKVRGGSENYIKDFKYGYGWGKRDMSSILCFKIRASIKSSSKQLVKRKKISFNKGGRLTPFFRFKS